MMQEPLCAPVRNRAGWVCLAGRVGITTAIVISAI
jgi:hypothetical protein